MRKNVVVLIYIVLKDLPYLRKSPREIILLMEILSQEQMKRLVLLVAIAQKVLELFVLRVHMVVDLVYPVLNVMDDVGKGITVR